MRKATLIWFPGPDKPFRSFTLGKRATAALIVTGVFCVVAALAFMVSLTGYLFDTGERARLSQQVEEQAGRIEALQAEHDELTGELERVHSMETRVRRFLGLETGEIPDAHPNQGGEGPSEPPPGDLPGPKSDASSASDGLDGVLAFLQDRQKLMRSVPTLLPVKGEDLWYSCGYGWRSNPFTGVGREFHNGLDIAGHWKTTIIAPADGVVVESGKDQYLGQFIRIDHQNGFQTSYGHLATRLAKRGQKVKRGDVIGQMGSSGRSTGVHLHYAVTKDNQSQNPSDFIWDAPNNPIAERI